MAHTVTPKFILPYYLKADNGRIRFETGGKRDQWTFWIVLLVLASPSLILFVVDAESRIFSFVLTFLFVFFLLRMSYPVPELLTLRPSKLEIQRRGRPPVEIDLRRVKTVRLQYGPRPKLTFLDTDGTVVATTTPLGHDSLVRFPHIFGSYLPAGATIETISRPSFSGGSRWSRLLLGLALGAAGGLSLWKLYEAFADPVPSFCNSRAAMFFLLLPAAVAIGTGAGLLVCAILWRPLKPEIRTLWPKPVKSLDARLYALLCGQQAKKKGVYRYPEGIQAEAKKDLLGTELGFGIFGLLMLAFGALAPFLYFFPRTGVQRRDDAVGLLGDGAIFILAGAFLFYLVTRYAREMRALMAPMDHTVIVEGDTITVGGEGEQPQISTIDLSKRGLAHNTGSSGFNSKGAILTTDDGEQFVFDPRRMVEEQPARA